MLLSACRCTEKQLSSYCQKKPNNPREVQSGPTNYSDMHYNENLGAPSQHTNLSLKLPFVWYGGWLEFVSWIVKPQLKIKQKG